MGIKYRRLGRHGAFVSNICLGTMNFGWHADERESFAIMDRALELGINFFDTADVYGWTVETGLTEQIIGRWLAQGGGRRESIILATKVYDHMERKNIRHEPNRDGENLSAVKIKRHCENSLRRLQTDCIDLYQMHHIDRDCPWDETWQAFHALIEQGKVVYVGSSNFAGWDIATACQEASKRGMSGLVSEQSTYNLSNRTLELEVIPACRHYGLGLMIWSPLAGGLLAGALEKPASGRRGDPDFAKRVQSHRQKLEAFETLCRKLGEPPAVVGLAWLLHNPAVSAPIVGPRNVKQLEDAVHAADLQLDSETLKQLDVIWPGPGGEAPKPYAW